MVSGAIELGGDEGRLKGYRLEDFEDVFARYLSSHAVSTRELVLGPEKPGETRDFELVISNPDHEMKNAEIPRACPHLSQASAQTSCNPARKLRAVFS